MTNQVNFSNNLVERVLNIKPKKLAILCASIVFIFGCMPSTINELQKKGTCHAFFVNEGYQQVYHDILHILYRCIPGAFFYLIKTILIQIFILTCNLVK